MLSLNATQQSIIDAANKSEVSWLFEVDANGNGSIDYYWSTKDKAWGTDSPQQQYDFKVIAFDPIRMQRAGSEHGIQRPTEFSFTISNKDNALTASDFSGGNVTVRQIVKADGDEAEIRSWSFDFVEQPEDVEQTLVFTCVDWLQKYLDGTYPNTPLVNYLFPKGNSKTEDFCVPLVFGKPTLPVAPIVKNLVTNGYMEEVGNWADWGVAPSVNARSDTHVKQGDYSRQLSVGGVEGWSGIKSDVFTTESGRTYLIDFWMYNDNCLLPWIAIRRGDDSGWIYNSDKFWPTPVCLDYDHKWVHLHFSFTEGAATGGAGAYIVFYGWSGVATTRTVWIDQVFLGQSCYILGEKITDPTDYDVEMIRTPTGWEGGEQEWSSDDFTFSYEHLTGADGADYACAKFIVYDSDGDGTPDGNITFQEAESFHPAVVRYSRSDTATMTNPGDILDYILQDMGIASAKIDATTLATVKAIYTGWGLAFNVGFWFYEKRETILARLLTMCHTELIVRDKIYFKIHAKTSQMSLDQADILAQGEQGPSTFQYKNIANPATSNAAYVAYMDSGGSLDNLISTLVTAKGSATQVADTTIRADYVQDSEDAQRIGTLAIQRLFLPAATLSLETKGTCMALEPDDVITLDNARYGGTYAVLIDAIEYRKDLSLKIEATRMAEALDDWADLSPSTIEFVKNPAGDSYQVMISGPDSFNGAKYTGNILAGKLRIGETGNYILFDPSKPIQEFAEGGVVRLKIGDLSTEDYGIELLDHAGNSIFKLDGSGTNTLVGFTVSATEFSSDSGNIKLNSAIPFFSLGAATDYLTGNGIWMGKVGEHFKEHHGDPSGQHWYWDPSIPKLYVKGDIEATSFIAAGTKADTFSVNSDQDDVDVKLILDRTTGGAASFKWDGSLVELDKSFKPSELGINDISNTAPETTFAGQVWLDTS